MMMWGDTTLTKVFVGGLAWETPEEAMRDHFQKYGEILEAVIIFDKLTGRSKGYGFVTFKDAEAAKRACEDPTPVINGRRANCNLASLGARRSQPLSATPQSEGPTVIPRPGSSTPPPSLQWYYPPTSMFHQNQHYGTPYHAYGYFPAFADMGYNTKGSNSASGSYTNGHYTQTQMYASQGMVTPNGVMPIYPFYHFHHQAQTMGVPAQMIFHPPTTPAFIPKPSPPAMPRNPNSG